MYEYSDEVRDVMQAACELLVEIDRRTREWWATGTDVKERERRRARATRLAYARANWLNLMCELEERGLRPSLLLDPLSLQLQDAIEYEPDLWEIQLCKHGLQFEPETIEWDWTKPDEFRHVQRPHAWHTAESAGERIVTSQAPTKRWSTTVSFEDVVAAELGAIILKLDEPQVDEDIVQEANGNALERVRYYRRSEAETRWCERYGGGGLRTLYDKADHYLAILDESDDPRARKNARRWLREHGWIR